MQTPSNASSRSAIVLAAVLRVLRPLVRLLLRHGVAYPAFAASLKQVFIDAATEELRRTGQKETDSSVSLLSGVHRRDVRTLGRGNTPAVAMEEPMNMASQVVSRWLSDRAYLDGRRRPRQIARSGQAPSFDALVAAISSDIRPRAVLDELVRLGIAEETEQGVRLLERGFVPRHGFAETTALLGDNLHDHAAAAALNLDSGHNYLEQAIFVDELTAESAQQLHAACARAWRAAFATVMHEAQKRHQHDQSRVDAAQRVHRVRFGTYFYACDNHDQPS